MIAAVDTTGTVADNAAANNSIVLAITAPGTTSPRAASAHSFLSPSCRHLDTPDATEWLAG
jgi:hypothetical protein